MEPERLAGLPVFADLDDGQRAEVAGSTREVRVEAGEAEVRRDGEVIASVGQGDVVGEIGLLVTGIRTASIVATTPMTLIAMFSREFKQVEDRMPAIAKGMRATMRDRGLARRSRSDPPATV